jgi:hypothetical protein
MKLAMIILLILFSAIVLICSMAETYTEKTGPFIINASSDEPVNFTVYPALPVDNCNPYDVNMDVSGKVTYRLEIQDYGKQINIVENNLMSAILSFNSVSSEYYNSWKLLKVGGKPGIIGTIGQGGEENGYPVHGCVAAYSPDGTGIHGTIIAIISFNTDKNNFDRDKARFEAFVKDIQILRTG